ncbi:uncharacterized protein LOC127719719 [Mytilus californianus]|uniref:uncharacterized protein LOC127719719 n=1 Tax=Mytilus californianus TaxID=6549 RepID=UPI0022477505|nr:uncharacterized protein LOC127719719 [Mytilus californianus]
MAIIETFPNILRDVVQSRISANQLYQKCVQVLKYFLPEQQINLAKLQHSNTYDSLDITLIYKLLRQFSLIPPPTKGWGSIPDKVAIKLGDDIERIRDYRNQLAHRCDTNIDKNVFDDYFDKFRDIGQRMDLYFYQRTDYERRIIRHRTCMMDTEMQAKYENAMKEIENIKMRFEKMPIKFYWGESFDRCLKNLRSMLKDEKAKGREKVRVQITFQNEEDVETTINILNSLKVEINEGLAGIEFIVATSGSVILNVDIMLKMLETDERLQTTMALFIEKILELFTTTPTESIAIVLLPVEEFTQWNKSKNIGEPVYLDFDIEAQLFETDDKIEEQLGQISDAVIKHSSGSGTNRNITATLLPISLENISTTEKAFAQAQTTVRYNLPVSVTLRQQLNVKKSINVNQNIWDCIKIGDTLAFTESLNNQLIICNADSTNIHHIPLHYKPWYLTEVDSTTVAISCMIDRTILMINISTGNVIDKIETSDYCYGISYNDNTLYVVIGKSIIHVMDLRGNVFRTIYLPADSTVNITADRDRLVCIDKRSIFCWSLDGKLIWTFENGKYESLRGVTTDNKGNVYVTDYYTNAVVEVSDEGKHHREILTKSDSLNHPCGIYFQKKENVLLVCNINDIKAFLFDVNRNINEQD